MPFRTILLNGKEVTAEYQAIGSGASESSEILLYWLREQFGQHGPRFGCGLAQCGACTVLVDDVPTRSCVVQLHTVEDLAEVRTLDGLSHDEKDPHPLQREFVELQAGQCGFCINGMIMGSLGWIEGRIAGGDRSVPSEDEVKAFLSGAAPGNTRNYICRCGTHTRIVAAIRSAAEEMAR
ncbi:oxidoreductase [Planotetraspora thailandica]|uniref:Oxidoreductase n=2 Tax=Planotetraspora thailandica TaxID=487172 RepID=A0A8J3XY73_9ACTN|nr:oxidoreductase [Planotetraspora thailandica]